MAGNIDADFAALARALRRVSVRVHDERGRGAGSGIVWDTRGIVVTNAHVVRGRTATIELDDGRSVRGDVVHRDDARDLAAVRIPAGIAPLAAGARDSRTLRVGELVVAVGNPLGLTGALTTGLVQRSNARYVVADVKLEPGNSGGALADSSGRVVGINSMVAGGLALAVPSTAVAAFLGWLGARAA